MGFKRNVFLTVTGAALALSSCKIIAQETKENQLDTLTRFVNGMSDDVLKLKRIKFSGYVQAQYQSADSSGIKSFSGGDFPANTDKRFKIRRAEFKTMYDNGITQVVANIDITQNGINIKDAYGKFTEQKLRAFSLTAGIFNRPFGFEVPYSSGVLESPERSRMIQTLFPGERDLGATITFQMPNTSVLNPLKIEAGFFNGTGNNVNDFDNKKDFIGNIHWNKATKSEKISYGIGVSYYDGGIANGTKFIYSDVALLSNGNNGFKVDSTVANKFAISKRNYIGADFQLNIDWIAGMTTIRGEFIQGQQPGTSSTTTSAGTQPVTDAYIRNFNGAYFFFMQNIMQTKHQLIVKYDWYDPNTKVAGDDIGKAGTKLGATDLKYTTLGLGWAYRFDTNVKFTLYYDMVTNETSKNLAGYSQDLKDNVVTLRMQYKF